MSEPIKSGDVVVVVRWGHPHGRDRSGMVFEVVGVHNGCQCTICDRVFDEPAVSWDGSTGALPASWVKRIPPLEELEGKLDLADVRGPQPVKEHC